MTASKIALRMIFLPVEWPFADPPDGFVGTVETLCDNKFSCQNKNTWHYGKTFAQAALFLQCGEKWGPCTEIAPFLI
jgi:hypothetical protein